MPECPKCQSVQIVKNGHHLGRQRYRCKACGFQYTRLNPRGRPASEKAAAVLLYTMGLSLNAIARIFVSAQPILRWARNLAEKTYEKPELREAVALELDEMRPCPRSKKTSYGGNRAKQLSPTPLVRQIPKKIAGCFKGSFGRVSCKWTHRSNQIILQVKLSKTTVRQPPLGSPRINRFQRFTLS